MSNHLHTEKNINIYKVCCIIVIKNICSHSNHNSYKFNKLKSFKTNLFCSEPTKTHKLN